MNDATHLVVYTPAEAALWGSNLTFPIVVLTVLCAALWVASMQIGKWALKHKHANVVSAVSTVSAVALWLYGMWSIAAVG